MSEVRRLGFHGVLTLVAVGAALYAWTNESKLGAAKAAEVEVWGGAPTELASVSFTDGKMSLELASESDRVGRYFVGRVTETVAPTPALAGAGGANAVDQGAAGAAGAGAPSSAAAAPPAPIEKTRHFISVTAASDLAALLAPLHAERRVGAVGEERVAAFGLNESPGTVTLRLGGAEHTLVLGGATPGGADRYARVDGGDVYAVSGIILRDLQGGVGRLSQRALHEWKAPDATKVRLTVGERSREVVRLSGADKADYWADAAAPTAADETVSNWLSKVQRLQVESYGTAETAPAGPAATLVRLDYYAGNDHLGYTELGRGAETKPGEPEYLVRSELTRWWGTTAKRSAQEVVDDLRSVLP